MNLLRGPAAAAFAIAMLADAGASAQIGEASFEGTGLPNASLRSETGASYMNLSLDRSALGVPTSSAGLVTGLALDVRVLSMLLGGRLRVHQLADHTAWQLGSSAGFRIPLGTRWHVGADVSAGYARVASFNSVVVETPPSGAFLAVTGSADWFFLRWLSAGAALDVELLFLDRVDRRGVGLSTSFGPRVALHF